MTTMTPPRTPSHSHNEQDANGSLWEEFDGQDESDEDEGDDFEGGTWGFKRQIPTTSLLLTINQLAVMSQNGIDLSEAVGTAANHASHPMLGERLRSIHKLIQSGSTLSAAIAANGSSFPRSMPAMIAAAESTGEVPQALKRMSQLMRAELQLRSTVIGALIYPVVLIVVSFAVMMAMLFGVLPQFSEVFGNLGRPMPASTAILLDAGKLARQYLWPIIGAMAALLMLAAYLRSHPLVRSSLDRFLLYAPMVRNAYRPLATGRMFRLLGSMIGGGVPLLQAVQLTRYSLNNGYFVELLHSVEADVLAGEQASRALCRADFLPPEAAQMVSTAERTGRLADVLCDCGEFYEEQGERVLRRIVHSLEPIIILVMGVLVAGVVLSIMLPLLDISSVA